MKRIIIVFFVLMMSFPLAANATKITEFGIDGSIFNSGETINVTAGQTFDINLFVSDFSFGNLAAFGFGFSIDNDINSDGIDETEILITSYSITKHEFILAPSPLSTGTFIVGTHEPSFSNANSQVFLATLTLRAGIAEGVGHLLISGIADNNFSGLYYLETPTTTQSETTNENFDGFLNIQINPIPEPGTILLFGMGLLGLAGISRKKR